MCDDIYRDVEKFWASQRTHSHHIKAMGEAAWERIVDEVKDRSCGAPGSIALDYGCGGGAVSRALLELGFKVHAVDICQTSLDENVRVNRFVTTHLISAGNPEQLVESVGAASIDFAISTAVFQHFPSKEYASRVLDVIGQLVKCGGMALIQVRNDDGSEKFQQKSGDYSTHAITYTSHTVEDFTGRAESAGFYVTRHYYQPHNAYMWYYLEKIR